MNISIGNRTIRGDLFLWDTLFRQDVEFETIDWNAERATGVWDIYNTSQCRLDPIAKSISLLQYFHTFKRCLRCGGEVQVDLFASVPEPFQILDAIKTCLSI